jgi:hypothetical protein
MVLGLLALPPERAAAQTDIETFTCESRDSKHNECRYRSSGEVTVHVKRQLSSSRCTFDESWGTFDGGVWVDYGCRAEFVVRRPPSAGTPSRPVGGGLKTISCESRDNRLQECNIPNIDPRSVHLERQLSSAPCQYVNTWNVHEEGIWVDKGCRAVFSYQVKDVAYAPYGGTQYDYEVPCESLRGEWVHCEVRSVRSARVEVRTSNDACNAYKAWGVDDTGIWVRSNCQGVFRVRYRH